MKPNTQNFASALGRIGQCVDIMISKHAAHLSKRQAAVLDTK
jgi:hypothetical protein